MARETIPNDPYRSADDPYRSKLADDARGPAHLDNELQPDPELAEGPASGGRVAMFAVAIAVVLGVVFYGLNNSSINQAGTSSTAQDATSATAQNAAPTMPPAAPPGMRDVTPHANTDQGVTTGAAPSRPQSPPSAAPTGQDINRSGNPPTAK
jgi:hypothetical protein